MKSNNTVYHMIIPLSISDLRVTAASRPTAPVYAMFTAHINNNKRKGNKQRCTYVITVIYTGTVRPYVKCVISTRVKWVRINIL